MSGRGRINFFFFYIFLAAPHSVWDLSSLTRDGNYPPCIRSVESIILS